MGDSISIQIANALDEMLLPDLHDNNNNDNDINDEHEQQPQQQQQPQLNLNARTQLWEAYPGADGGTLLAPTRGGGIHGSWRITALFSKAAQGMPDTKNKPGGGWNYHQVHPFLRHVYSPFFEEKQKKNGNNVTVQTLDVVVFRVMQGWMKCSEITRERVVEAAEMAHSILGAETLIFLTVPFTNNVLDLETYEAVSKINDMIRDVANNWHLDHNNDSQMLVMDYGGFSNHIIWANARNMGYKNVSNPLASISNPKVFDVEGPNFLLERLNVTDWPPSIPHVCAKKPTKESYGAHCERNMLFKDGMHFCTETLAARIGAAMACLLGCVYNRRDSVKVAAATAMPSQEGPHDFSSTTATRMVKLRACERQCNEQFMSVRPIPESWINSTLASFSDF